MYVVCKQANERAAARAARVAPHLAKAYNVIQIKLSTRLVEGALLSVSAASLL